MAIASNKQIFTQEVVFQIFKYSIYLLLAFDIYHFFVEDFAASTQTFAKGVSPSQVIEAFTATIDTAAWLILLLLFELETYVLDDDKIEGLLKWSIKLTRLFCYSVIIYSCYGFISKWNLLHNTVPFVNDNVCHLIGSSFTYIKEIDKYLPLTLDVCNKLANTPLIQIVGTEIITDKMQLIETQRLSTVEVTNSATWLIVVFILEVEVFLQLKGRLTDKKILFSKWIKYVLYTLLFFVAGYWGVKGGLLDFWDAFLWLVAFWFIELNIFQWNTETNKVLEQNSASLPQEQKS